MLILTIDVGTDGRQHVSIDNQRNVKCENTDSN